VNTWPCGAALLHVAEFVSSWVTVEVEGGSAKMSAESGVGGSSEPQTK